MPNMASIQISISIRLAQLALIQISKKPAQLVTIQIGIRPKMAAAEKTKSSNIKLQYCTFNMLLISIYIPSIASKQISISVKLVQLALI